jgi:phenylpyruvate tautomerase PptA (4-oxalocrotonate tautomerase family)
MALTEHEPANFRTGSAYGVARSADTVYIQIAVFSTRTAEQKKAVFRRVAELLAERPGLCPQDVFVVVQDGRRRTGRWVMVWRSFGEGHSSQKHRVSIRCARALGPWRLIPMCGDMRDHTDSNFTKGTRNDSVGPD